MNLSHLNIVVLHNVKYVGFSINSFKRIINNDNVCYIDSELIPNYWNKLIYNAHIVICINSYNDISYIKYHHYEHSKYKLISVIQNCDRVNKIKNILC